MLFYTLLGHLVTAMLEISSLLLLMLCTRYELTFDTSLKNTIEVLVLQMFIAYRWKNRTERHNCISESNWSQHQLLGSCLDCSQSIWVRKMAFTNNSPSRFVPSQTPFFLPLYYQYLRFFIDFQHKISMLDWLWTIFFIINYTCFI